MKIKNLNQVMHYFAHQFVTDDTLIIDATCGNGNDTYFLASNFANDVIAIDIQKQAIDNTKKRCSEFANIKYHLLDHKDIGTIIDKPVSFAVFNLGYLPNSESNLTTTADSSIKAITSILEKLIRGGGIVISIYTNHDHHQEEQQVLPFLSTLDKHQYLVMNYKFINLEEAPYLVIIEKK